MRGSITTPVDPLPPLKTTRATPAFSDLGLSHRTFTLHMFAANKTYNHKEVVSRNPLHGPWPSNGNRETFVSAALRKSIPSGAMAPALRDWHTANQLERDSASFADEGAEGAAAVFLGKKRLSSKEVYLMERIRARRNAKKIPAVMKSLANFANAPDQLPTLDPWADTHDSHNELDGLGGNSDLVVDAEPLLDSAPEHVPSDPDRPVGTSEGAPADESKLK